MAGGREVALEDSLCRAVHSGSAGMTRTTADGMGVVTVRGTAEVPYAFL